MSRPKLSRRDRELLKMDKLFVKALRVALDTQQPWKARVERMRKLGATVETRRHNTDTHYTWMTTKHGEAVIAYSDEPDSFIKQLQSSLARYENSVMALTGKEI